MKQPSEARGKTAHKLVTSEERDHLMPISQPTCTRKTARVQTVLPLLRENLAYKTQMRVCVTAHKQNHSTAPSVAEHAGVAARTHFGTTGN